MKTLHKDTKNERVWTLTLSGTTCGVKGAKTKKWKNVTCKNCLRRRQK